MNKNRSRWFFFALAIFPPLAHFSQERDQLPISGELYLQRLQTVAAETLKNEYEIEFMLLLDGKEKQYYEALSLPERRGFIARYWRLRDPDPFTPNNERLEEHLRRRYFARENFKAGAPLYFDDRGKIYLKYGRPKDRYVDPGIYMQENRELSIFLPDVEYFGESAISDSGVLARGTIAAPLRTRVTSADLLPPGKVIVLENETWSYEHLQPGLVFNFVRQGSTFKLVTDLSKAVTGGRERHRILQATVMYLRRQNMSRVYLDLAREFEDVGQRLRTQPGGLQLKLLDNEIRVALNQSVFALEDISRKSPPEAFVRRAKEPELPFVADVAQFRGENKQTRIAVGFGANIGFSGAPIDSTAAQLTGVSYNCVMNDWQGEAIAQAELQQSVPQTADGMASVLGSIGQVSLSCAPEQYLVAVRAIEMNGFRKSVIKFPLAVRDFTNSHLMLSDIQFYVQIPPTSSAPEAAVQLASAKMIPYPFSTVLQSMPLTIYFEIYNVAIAAAGPNYRLDYHVTETKTNKNILGKIAGIFAPSEKASIALSELRAPKQSTVREFMTLDFGKLRPGTYRLEVTVSALRDSSLFASVVKPFVLAEK
jgi:GWxTD domain-containing protein